MTQSEINEEESLTGKGWFLAIMCYFLGVIGVHRFLVGKTGTGILYACSAGLFGIGIIVDLIMILTGNFTDKDGNCIPLGL